MVHVEMIGFGLLLLTTKRCAVSSGQWKDGSEGVDMEVQVSGGDSLAIASWSIILFGTQYVYGSCR